MARRRRRSRGGGISRRRFLVGGLLSLGGASVLGGTQAFSQVDATRATSIETTGDENALLGVEPVTSVQQGDEGVDLVTVTNNTDGTLAVTVALDDPSQGQLSKATPTLASGGSADVLVDVASDSPTGTDALAFSVSATDGDDFSVSLTRAVDVTSGPELRQQVYDQTQDSNAAYAVAYSVRNVDGFDRIEIAVENIDAGHIGTETYVQSSPEGTIDYPPGSDDDGGAEGDTYEFRFRVFDGDGRVTPLDTTVQDDADGSNPPGDNLGDENDPTFDWLFVDDFSMSWDGVQYTVYYQVSNAEDFGEAEVTLDRTNSQQDPIQQSTQNPVGKVQFSTNGYGNEFNINASLTNSSGIEVDSISQLDTADGENPNNPTIATADSPTFGSISVTDTSSNGGAEYEVTYSVDNVSRFGEVRAHFENLSGSQQTNERFSSSNPSDSFSYSAGYTGGEQYRITVRIFENRAGVLIPVASNVVTDVADGQDP